MKDFNINNKMIAGSILIISIVILLIVNNVTNGSAENSTYCGKVIGKNISYIGIGQFQEYEFTECNYSQSFKSKVTNELGAKNTLLAIQYDFNNDSKNDFLVKIQNSENCKRNELCPMHLYLYLDDRTYQKYEGPTIKGNKIGISKAQYNNISNTIFYSNVPGHCLWEWAKGANQDYYCALGTTIQPSNN